MWALFRTSGIGIEALEARFKAKTMINNGIYKAGADRFAEAHADSCIKKCAKSYGDMTQPRVTQRALQKKPTEEFRPAQRLFLLSPETLPKKRTIFSQLNANNIGMYLPKAVAMMPCFIVSGLLLCTPRRANTLA